MDLTYRTYESFSYDKKTRPLQKHAVVYLPFGYRKDQQYDVFYLIPAVDARFSTLASRDHRGFGGFSMGAVTTWRTFQYGLDSFRYVLPMSCGTSLNDDRVFAAASQRHPEDYFVFVMTGTGYSHDGTAAMEYTYNGMKAFWEKGN